MTRTTKCLLITGGGSGGHIFPGLAVARYLIENNGWRVCWLGSFGNLEEDLVPKNGIEIRFIHAVGFCGKIWYKKLMSLLYVCISIFKACSIIRCWKPDVVLSTGGYVSISVSIAAKLCGCPVIVHEQNSISGVANRFLSKIIAKQVLQAFPNTFQYAERVGNPVRDIILAVQEPEHRLSNRIGPIRLLIVGGSQGAQIFNDILPKVLPVFLNQFIVWHQVGKGKVYEVYCSYGSFINNVYKVVEFIDDIGYAYAWADIVICRAGALTVSEIACVGLAAIFVPFSHRDSHQYWNAFPLQQIGAAKILKEQEFTVYGISKILSSLCYRPLLLEMAKCAKHLCISDATKKVVYKIINQVMY